MVKRTVVLAFAFFFLISLNAVFAQRGTARADVVNIRFASPLPRNSEWGRALDRLAADWARVTDNAVRVVITHDGREGSEARMLSSLSSNAIQAGLFTSGGISKICPPIMTLSIPFMIRNDEEFNTVFNAVRPYLESRVDNNFVIISWSKGGWVYVFSQEPVFAPEDLRRQRIATNEETRDINQAFRAMGFTLVETEIASLAPRLASNMINAIYFLPEMIAPMQLHRHLRNMLNIPIAPFVGAIVINRVTWNQISPAHQQEIIRVTQRVAAEFDAAMPRTKAAAIASMDRSGLRVNTPTPAQERLWRTEIEKAMPALIGNVFDRELYQQINTVLQRIRSE